MTDSEPSQGINWHVIGAIAGVVGAIAAVVALMIGTQSGSDSPGATNVPIPPPTTLAVPVEPSGAPIGPTAGSRPSTSMADVDQRIVKFEAFPRYEKYLIGDHEFLATEGSNSLQLSFVFEVKGPGGIDISDCTITSIVTTLDGSNSQNATRGAAQCPSRSYATVTRGYMKPGRYRLDSKVFVPSTGETAETSYEFVIRPSG